MSVNIIVKAPIVSDKASSFLSRCDAIGTQMLPFEINAINRLCFELEYYNIWHKLIAFYPFVGRSSASFALNMVGNIYGLTYTGTLTYTNLGIRSSSASSWALTGIPLTTSFWSRYDISAGVYRTVGMTPDSRPRADFGSSYTATGNTNRFYMTYNSTQTTDFNGAVGLDGVGATNVSQGSVTGLGLKMFSVTPEDLIVRAWNNGINTFASSMVADWRQTSGTIRLLNLSGNTLYTTSVTLGAAFFSRGLTPNECVNLYNIIQAFQITMGRSV